MSCVSFSRSFRRPFYNRTRAPSSKPKNVSYESKVTSRRLEKATTRIPRIKEGTQEEATYLSFSFSSSCAVPKPSHNLKHASRTREQRCRRHAPSSGGRWWCSRPYCASRAAPVRERDAAGAGAPERGPPLADAVGLGVADGPVVLVVDAVGELSRREVGGGAAAGAGSGSGGAPGRRGSRALGTPAPCREEDHAGWR